MPEPKTPEPTRTFRITLTEEQLTMLTDWLRDHNGGAETVYDEMTIEQAFALCVSYGMFELERELAVSHGGQ